MSARCDRHHLDIKIKAISALIDSGIYWISEQREFVDRIFDDISSELTGTEILKLQEDVAFDWIFVDIVRHPNCGKWLNEHAARRMELSEAGIPYGQLPLVPGEER